MTGALRRHPVVVCRGHAHDGADVGGGLGEHDGARALVHREVPRLTHQVPVSVTRHAHAAVELVAERPQHGIDR
jgi:hypothetical protein